MIIRVCTPPEAIKDGNDHDIFKALRNVLLAYGEAKHIAWMHYSVINFLKESMELGGHEKRILKELEEVENEYRFFHAQVGFHVNLDLIDKYRMEYSAADGCIHVGYGNIKDTACLQKISLLVEGVLDYKILLKASESCLDLKKLNKFKVDFELVNGAGGQSVRFFNELKEDNRFFLCVLDSDKKHPCERVGGTAHALRNEAKGRDGGRELLILESSEIENIIPCKIMLDAVEKNCTVEVFSLFENFVKDAPRDYLDHKLGISKEKAHELDDQYGNYWRDTQAYRVAEDGGWLCKGLSENIGWRCFEIMDEMSIKKLNLKVCDVQDKEWIRLGESLLAWGISRSKVIN